MLFLVFKGEEVGEGCLVVCLGTSGRRKLGMVPYIAIIFMRFGLAGAKRCGRRFKVINRGWQCMLQKGDSYRDERFSLCNTTVLKSYFKSYCVSFHYMTAVLPVLYL